MQDGKTGEYGGDPGWHLLLSDAAEKRVLGSQWLHADPCLQEQDDGEATSVDLFC